MANYTNHPTRQSQSASVPSEVALTPETAESAKALADALAKMRPHDPFLSKLTLDQTVAMAISMLSADIDRRHPGYLVKPARCETK